MVVQTRADFLVRTLRLPWVVHKPCPGKVGMGVQCPPGGERGPWSPPAPFLIYSKADLHEKRNQGDWMGHWSDEVLRSAYSQIRRGGSYQEPHHAIPLWLNQM